MSFVQVIPRREGSAPIDPWDAGVSLLFPVLPNAIHPIVITRVRIVTGKPDPYVTYGVTIQVVRHYRDAARTRDARAEGE